VFWYIEIHKPLAMRGGYDTYVAIFYVLAAMLFVSVGICL